MEVGRYPVQSELFALELDDKPVVGGLRGGLRERHGGKAGLDRDRRTEDLTERLLEIQTRYRLKLQVNRQGYNQLRSVDAT